MNQYFKRIIALAMTAVMVFSISGGVSAADSGTATIDTGRSASLTLYKYDLTGAEQDGLWDAQSYVSTGLADEAVNTSLSQYALEGVEFSYCKLADLGIYKGTGAEGQQETVSLYAFPENTKTGSRETTDFLSALGLTTNDAYRTDHDDKQNRIWYFQSDVLIDALEQALTANATGTKDALEQYMAANGGTAMPETDENGYSKVEDLSQGLYLLVETKVPENVTATTAPFLVSLPMTTVDGSDWNYDVTLYPKNETGNPTLEKTVRESRTDTGKNAGKPDDITDGYAHTATASDGDVVEYQILSTLPTITSSATALTTYTFVDNLSRGIQYNTGDVEIAFFTDAECTDLITTWKEADSKFQATYTDYSSESGSSMTISMTEAGLTEMNAATTVYDSETSLLRGYSNCTLRITYSCTLGSDAATVYGDSGNPNDVTLTWQRSNMDYYDTLQDCCHIYTYGLDLTKQFSDDAGNFGNVTFLLKNSTDHCYVQAELNKSEGIYYVTGHTESETDATQFSPMSGSVNTGKVVVKGLEDDSYTITETATDEGYVLLNEDITVEISTAPGTETCPVCETALLTATAKVNGKDVEMDEDNSSVHALVPLTVTNTRGFDLPKTGGRGNLAFYGLGAFALLTAGAVTVLYLRKRRHG